MVACLLVTAQPQNHYRFRYYLEKKKTFLKGALLSGCPSVKLVNFTGRARVQVSLIDKDQKSVGSCHLNGTLEKIVDSSTSYEAKFSDLRITALTKKERPSATQAATHAVYLCFKSFYDNVNGDLIGQVISEPIHNSVNADTAPLNIKMVHPAQGREGDTIAITTENRATDYEVHMWADGGSLDYTVKVKNPHLQVVATIQLPKYPELQRRGLPELINLQLCRSSDRGKLCWPPVQLTYLPTETRHNLQDTDVLSRSDIFAQDIGKQSHGMFTEHYWLAEDTSRTDKLFDDVKMETQNEYTQQYYFLKDEDMTCIPDDVRLLYKYMVTRYEPLPVLYDLKF